MVDICNISAYTVKKIQFNLKGSSFNALSTYAADNSLVGHTNLVTRLLMHLLIQICWFVHLDALKVFFVS